MKAREEKDRLWGFIRWRGQMASYVSGEGGFVRQLSQTEAKEFSRLARKYKYDPEFQMEML